MPAQHDPHPQPSDSAPGSRENGVVSPGPAVAGLAGRSPDRVKAIEHGSIGMPRLPMLMRLADIYGCDVTEQHHPQLRPWRAQHRHR
ncbi:helix-turn-helix domain-containing protein [Streptomyces xanthophaeus]|uniref:helix-turn-helix domain-containing protein n=1 Tax=Streptomyces xanthophaeus TaxID=67385 RepID=UPI00399007CA